MTSAGASAAKPRSYLPHCFQEIGRHEQLLAPGAARPEVDGGIDAPLGHLAAQHQFAVAGALELLEDHLVHLASGVDQRRGDDRERAGAAPRVDLARAAEEALRCLERLRVEAAGQGASGAALGGVEGPGQPGDGIEDDDGVATLLDPAARALHRELREGHMALGGMVEAGGDDLAHPRHFHLAHFLGPFVHQQDEELGLRVVVRDAGGDGLQHGGLAGLGGGDDQRALAEAERCDEVDEATGHVTLPARRLGAFELEHPARVHRGEPVEVGPAPGLLGGRAR